MLSVVEVSPTTNEMPSGIPFVDFRRAQDVEPLLSLCPLTTHYSRQNQPLHRTHFSPGDFEMTLIIHDDIPVRRHPVNVFFIDQGSAADADEIKGTQHLLVILEYPGDQDGPVRIRIDKRVIAIRLKADNIPGVELVAGFISPDADRPGWRIHCSSFILNHWF